MLMNNKNVDLFFSCENDNELRIGIKIEKDDAFVSADGYFELDEILGAIDSAVNDYERMGLMSEC